MPYSTASAATRPHVVLALSCARHANYHAPAISITATFKFKKLRSPTPSMAAQQFGQPLRRWRVRQADVRASANESQDDAVEVELKVEGMMCDGCTSRVQEALEKLDGVRKVAVDLEKGVAAVQVDTPSQIVAFNELPRLVEAVKALGFEATPVL